MDPVTVAAVLLAIVSGAAGKAGEHLWDDVAALVRRPFARQREGHRRGEPVQSGSTELAALELAPHDQQRAVALATALLARADADDGFRRELAEWWARANGGRASEPSVINQVSGGTQYGPVLQGRDFTGLTFGAASEPTAP